ncbi:MAG TPA: SpoIIE family protein phosphatase [Solirubrobacterales bacterium]|nr:SpoIIE family protein phosphatase [Solirubrobacterales bacterium]
MIPVAVAVAVAAVALALVVAAAVTTSLAVMQVRRMNRRFEVLDEIAHAVDDGGDLEETLDAITAILVPELGDFCTIDLIEDERVRRVAVGATGPDAETTRARLASRRPSLQAEMATEAIRGRVEPRFFEHVDEEVLREAAADEEDLELLRSLKASSSVIVELRARGRATGMLTIGVGHSGRRLGSADVRFLSVLAGRVALALDNAGLFTVLERSERERAEIAATLQRGLLPPPLPHIPGWSVAAMYRPAGAENEIGGDFYDAFRIAGGWMVVIGDVTGRGAQAAAVTAHARYTLRTAAALTNDPVVALRTLNRELLGRGTALCSVAAIAIAADPAEPVRLAVAGHPPPLLVDGDSVTEASTPAPVLGAFPDEEWRVEATAVAPGQQLVVITDGITEAESEEKSERFGEERLRAELVGIASPALAAQQLEGALHEFTGGRMEDDAAIVAVGPASPAAEPAPAADVQLVERLYEAFNHRDAGEITELCDQQMGFFPVGTAEEVGRRAPYVGPTGLEEYLGDVERAWDELIVTPKVVERHGASLLVQGRAYARGRALGIRDMPVAWIWELDAGRITRGEVFRDPEEAVRRLATAT